jgi:heme/copper-type cytochrome/quinol oxidase subunit 2
MSTRTVMTGLSLVALVLAACAPASDDAPLDTIAPEDAAAAEAAAGGAEAEQPADEAVAGGSEAPAVGTGEPEVESVEPEQVTAYVVSYHWGWAIFDEEGIELGTLEVAVGTTLELIAVNDHATHAIDQLPGAVAEAVRTTDWHERAHDAVREGRVPDPEEEIGMTMSEALRAAHDGHNHMSAAQDHGLMVAGVGAQAFLDAHAHEPERLVFTVDREGTFEFRCTEDCGFGHRYQRWDMLIVA